MILEILLSKPVLFKVKVSNVKGELSDWPGNNVKIILNLDVVKV